MTALLLSLLLVSPPAPVDGHRGAPRAPATSGFDTFLLLPLLIPMPLPIAVVLPAKPRATLAASAAREAESARRETARRTGRRLPDPALHRRVPR
ncbi:hypothetical protein [Anaeromyxobacter oryzisoli]|uniref:hypothetical protein n=1 Tax=Anaeromyxobacter oryzisoli TaxID=2925408 RepID=UPI001F57BF4B|nr:hypothetical protein [Anaeromyxobacter sp. SG63]